MPEEDRGKGGKGKWRGDKKEGQKSVMGKKSERQGDTLWGFTDHEVTVCDLNMRDCIKLES